MSQAVRRTLIYSKRGYRGGRVFKLAGARRCDVMRCNANNGEGVLIVGQAVRPETQHMETNHERRSRICDLIAVSNLMRQADLTSYSPNSAQLRFLIVMIYW